MGQRDLWPPAIIVTVAVARVRATLRVVGRRRRRRQAEGLEEQGGAGREGCHADSDNGVDNAPIVLEDKKVLQVVLLVEGLMVHL